jgi:hypothetical protein
MGIEGCQEQTGSGDPMLKDTAKFRDLQESLLETVREEFYILFWTHPVSLPRKGPA